MFPESIKVKVVRKTIAENFTNFISKRGRPSRLDREGAWSRATQKFGPK